MSLLSRRSNRAIPVLILFSVTALLALPVSWSVRAPGNAMAPALVWAGGSPDETLGPNPGAPKKTTRAPDVKTSDRSAAVTFGSPATIRSPQYGSMSAVSARYLWTVLWRVSLATAVRF